MLEILFPADPDLDNLCTRIIPRNPHTLPCPVFEFFINTLVLHVTSIYNHGGSRLLDRHHV